MPVPSTGPRQLVLLCDGDGLLTYVSAGSVALLGRQPAEMTGTPLLRYLPEQVGHQGLRPARHTDGSTVWLEVVSRGVKGAAGGEGSAVLHTATDATARVTAELALADRLDRLGAAFDEAPIGMALTAVDGRHLKVNAALCRLLGRSQAELLGLRWQDVTHPEDREADGRQLEASLAGRQEGYRMAKRYVRGDGSAVACQLQVRLLLDPDGAPRYVVAHVQLAG